jgi:hypothetical protein
MKDKLDITDERPSGIKVQVRPFGSPKIAELLQATVFGTPGKVRYRQKEIVQRMKSQRNIEFIEVQKGTRVLGTTGVISRPAHLGNEPLHTLYVRYLSVAAAFNKKPKKAGSGFNTTVIKPATTRKPGRLHQLIGEQITGHFEQPFLENNQQGAFYAYVEAQNENSRNLCISMGFQPVRKVNTLLFSRFSPTLSKHIVNPAQSDFHNIRRLLHEFYKDHSFFFEDQIFNTGFYLVKKVKGEIVAGLRANPVNWQLVEYPGFEGWLMKDILPYLPFTNRLFKPGEMAFLSFDNLFYTEGNDGALLKYHIGMVWGDAGSPLIKTLKQKDLGFMHSVVGPVSADLMVRPINADEVTLKKIQESPVFVSALDMT